MSKTRDTGYLANVIQVHNTGVRIMSGSEMLMAISSSGQVTITGELSGSDAANSLLLDGTGSLAFTTTSSFLVVSASQQQISSSLLQVSASYISLSGSYNTFSGSASTRITTISSSQQDISSSQQQISSSLLNVIAVYATTGSNSFRATQSITGSLTVTGQIIAQTINVQQVTSSIIYSSGSNVFGCDLNSRQTFTGSVNITGSQNIFGNVGIGTVNPIAPLTIKSSGATGIFLACDTTNAGASSRLFFESCYNQFSILNNAGKLQFNYAASAPSTSGVLGMVMDSSGSLLVGTICTTMANASCIGIGTQTPVSLLHINTSLTTADILRISNGTQNLTLGLNNGAGGSYIFENCAQDFRIGTSSTERMRITSAGCVGIGTTAPQTNLHVLNCADGVVGGSYIGQLIVERNGEAAINIKGLTYSSVYFGDASNAIEGAIVYNHSTNNLELRGSGNVADLTIASTGIASFTCQVCAPTLEITSTNTNVYPRVNRSSTSYESGWKLATGGTDSWYTGLRSADGVGSYHFYSYTTNTSVVAITCNGRVGIGTGTPDYPLHIYGCINLGMKIQTCGSSFGSPSINLLNGGVDTVLSATNNGLEIGTWSANDIIFRTTQVERMRINTAGIITMPQQPSMFAQPGAVTFPIGFNQTAYGWCTSGSVRYNCGFTLTAATSAACNIADAGATGKIRIPATGKYLLQFSQRNEAQCTSTGQFYLWVNGTVAIRRHIELWNTTQYIHVDVTAILPLNINDCLEMGAWFNGNGKTDTFSGTNDTVNWLSLAKIS